MSKRVQFERRTQYVAHVDGHKVTVALLPRADGKRSHNWWAEIRAGTHSRTPLLWERDELPTRVAAERVAIRALAQLRATPRPPQGEP